MGVLFAVHLQAAPFREPNSLRSHSPKCEHVEMNVTAQRIALIHSSRAYIGLHWQLIRFAYPFQHQWIKREHG